VNVRLPGVPDAPGRLDLQRESGASVR